MDNNSAKLTIKNFVDKVNFDSVIKYLIFLLVILAPLTHKESFSIFDQDMVFSKFVLVVIGVYGGFHLVKKRADFVKDPVFLLLSIFLGFNIFSLLQSQDLFHSIRMVVFLGTTFLTYPVVKMFLSNDKDNLKKLIFVYSLAFWFVFLFLLMQIWLNEVYTLRIGGIWPVPDYPTRYGSTFWDVNHYGIYLVSMIMIFVGAIFTFKDRLLKAYFLVSVLAGIFALYNTSSRSALIGMFFGLLLFIFAWVYKHFNNTKQKFPHNIIALAIAFLPIAFISFIYIFADNIRNLFLYRAASFFSHLFLLKEGIETGISNFLLGIGTNSFHAYFRQNELSSLYYYIDPAAANYKLPLHNLWLEVFAETGIVSFVFFLILWVVILGSLLRLFIKNKDYLALGFASAIFAFLTAGFTYSYKSEFFWFFVIVGSAYSVINIAGEIKLTLPLKKHFKEYFAIVFGRKINFKNLTICLLSLIVIVVPLFFIFEPLQKNEINFINLQTGNPLSNIYLNIIDLFRYVFGNYSYVVRIAEVSFYLSVVGISIVLASKKMKFVYAISFTAIFTAIVSFIYPVVNVFPVWYFLYILALIKTIVLLLFDKKLDKKLDFLGKISFNNKLLIIILVFSIFTVALNNYIFFKKGNPKDLSLLIELAYNKSMFDRSGIYIDRTIDKDLVEFYCQNIAKKDGKYIRENCNASTYYIPQYVYPDLSRVNTILGSIEKISTWQQITNTYQGQNISVLQTPNYGAIFIVPDNVVRK